jgi:hypothetical protein
MKLRDFVKSVVKPEARNVASSLVALVERKIASSAGFAG